MLTVAVLSWGSPETLNNTLSSYAYHGLDAEQKIVLLQEGTMDEENIAHRWGFTTLTVPVNVGIARGYRVLLDAATQPFFMFLENDWELISEPNAEISIAQSMINSKQADLVRFRHRENPGQPLWTRQFQGREYERPTHLLDSIHWLNDTELLRFPEIFPQRFEFFITDPVALYTEGNHAVEILPTMRTKTFFKATARNANWTNNPHMARTQFLRVNVAPRLGNDNLEASMQGWWEQQDFIVAQSDGLFTHNRLD